MLVHRYGTITAAWRQLLDPVSTGRLSFIDFCEACRELGYQRRMKQLWEELDADGKGWITLAQIDPEGAKLLEDFRECCRREYGDMLKAWKAFDLLKNHRIDDHEFDKACADINVPGNHKRIFQLLKTNVARKYLTMS